MDNINNSGNSVYRNNPPYNHPYNSANSAPANAGYWTPAPEAPEVLDMREKIGRKLGLATLIYAIFSTFCLYNNLTGITMPFFGIATLVYMIYELKQYEVSIKKLGWFYAVILLALTISNFLTGNATFHFFNNFGIILMLFIFLLHNVYDDSKWSFTKTACAICEAFSLSIVALGDFGKDMSVVSERNKERRMFSDKKNPVRYIVIGLLISIPVVAILLMLLSAADAVFSNIITRHFSPNFNIGTFFGVLITFAFIFLASYCIMRFFSKKTINEEVKDHKNLEPIVAITVLSIISAIYLVFSLIQIIYLFLGGGSLPEGYSYSDYAREGFFQLLAVSIINFLMVIFVNSFFRNSRVLKVLMTIISLCTYIMIASSFVRIMMYIKACLLTELRIWVVWGLTVLSLLFVAVIISIFNQKFPLFRYCIVVVSTLYVILGFMHIDYIIADYDITNLSTIGEEISIQDMNYLAGLSTDAAPAIAKCSDDWADDYFNRNEYYYKNRNWRQFNLSAYTADVLSKTR